MQSGAQASSTVQKWNWLASLLHVGPAATAQCMTGACQHVVRIQSRRWVSVNRECCKLAGIITCAKASLQHSLQHQHVCTLTGAATGGQHMFSAMDAWKQAALAASQLWLLPAHSVPACPG